MKCSVHFLRGLYLRIPQSWAFCWKRLGKHCKKCLWFVTLLSLMDKDERRRRVAVLFISLMGNPSFTPLVLISIWLMLKKRRLIISPCLVVVSSFLSAFNPDNICSIVISRLILWTLVLVFCIVSSQFSMSERIFCLLFWF